ncbi:DUF4148 domain-containing protein [Xylophilus sp. GW821-FHT01B05]
MKSRNILAVSALALLSTLGAAAHAAGEGDDLSSRALQFQSQRDRTEVQAEAVYAAHNRNMEGAGSRVLPRVNSSVSRAEVRDQAIQAVRTGQIAEGENPSF